MTTVTSVIILTQRQKTIHTGTLEQLESQCHQTFIHNLLFGWWGFPFGLVFTPIALVSNHRALRDLRALVAGAAR
ncbi:MAG: hypothetical protein JF887_02775 [Candidatus Dormibacteraeota bacterium]|uniref:Uncharacterized protein n=1 Tax=Candidatus Amunia macphersoniae TaxID=3127014 RepID=A0A934KKU0_9BACT|nr:hypothetical protein [Candidatus Dormibacteraeota bacterium]